MKTNSLVIDYNPVRYGELLKGREVIKNVKTADRAREIISKRHNIKNAVWFKDDYFGIQQRIFVGKKIFQ
jgi:hypothetical protein